jgi:hypothetical protein
VGQCEGPECTCAGREIEAGVERGRKSEYRGGSEEAMGSEEDYGRGTTRDRIKESGPEKGGLEGTLLRLRAQATDPARSARVL